MLSINSNLAKHVECGPDELIRHITRAVYTSTCVLLFHLFLQYGYLLAIISYLVKNKNGDLSSLNNYGAIPEDPSSLGDA